MQRTVTVRTPEHGLSGALKSAERAYLAAEDVAVEAALDILMDANSGRISLMHMMGHLAARAFKKAKGSARRRL